MITYYVFSKQNNSDDTNNESGDTQSISKSNFVSSMSFLFIQISELDLIESNTTILYSSPYFRPDRWYNASIACSSDISDDIMTAAAELQIPRLKDYLVLALKDWDDESKHSRYRLDTDLNLQVLHINNTMIVLREQKVHYKALLFGPAADRARELKRFSFIENVKVLFTSGKGAGVLAIVWNFSMVTHHDRSIGVPINPYLDPGFSVFFNDPPSHFFITNDAVAFEYFVSRTEFTEMIPISNSEMESFLSLEEQCPD